MARVRFSRDALRDLHAIEDYLTARSPQAASRIIAAIEHSAGLLAEFPSLGPPLQGGPGRFLVVPRYAYVLSYAINGEDVEIRAVFHPSQDKP